MAVRASSSKFEPGPADRSLLSIFLDCRSYLGWIIGRIAHPQDVEDIVQETFVRSYEASTKTRIRHPRSFMVATAKNLALNHITTADSRLTERVASFPDATPSLATEPLEDRVDSQERLLLFCRAVERLPLQCRRAFVLKKVYGLKRKEIARRLGISERTAQKHIAKGMRMCADYLDAFERPAHYSCSPSRSNLSGGRRRRL